MDYKLKFQSFGRYRFIELIDWITSYVIQLLNYVSEFVPSFNSIIVEVYTAIQLFDILRLYFESEWT